MSLPSSDRAPLGLLGPDPGRMVRVWVTMLLRLGVGLSLLSTGLAGYLGQGMGRGVGGMFGFGPSFNLLDPFLSAVPYAAIAVGLALIFGFLTTAAAIGAGVLGLIPPILAIIHLLIARSVGSPGFRGGGPIDDYLSMILSMTLPNLLTYVALIWFSPLENNPYSIDALIFGRDEIEPLTPRSEPVPAPEPVIVEATPLRIDE